MPLPPLLQQLVALARHGLVVDFGRQISLAERREPARGALTLALRTDEDAVVLSFEQCLLATGRSEGELPDWLFPLLAAEQGVRQSCDFVVLRESRDAIEVLLVELKGRQSEAARNQVANSRLVIDALLDTVTLSGGHPFHGSDRGPQRRYRGVVCKPTAKRPKGRGNGFQYLPLLTMPDVGVVSLPYQQFWLQDFWVG